MRSGDVNWEVKTQRSSNIIKSAMTLGPWVWTLFHDTKNSPQSVVSCMLAVIGHQHTRTFWPKVNNNDSSLSWIYHHNQHRGQLSTLVASDPGFPYRPPDHAEIGKKPLQGRWPGVRGPYPMGDNIANQLGVGVSTWDPTLFDQSQKDQPRIQGPIRATWPRLVGPTHSCTDFWTASAGSGTRIWGSPEMK